MAEDTALEAMEGAVELQPLVDGIKHVADFSTKNTKTLDEKIEKLALKSTREVGDLKEEFNKSYENLLARVNHGIDLNVMKLSTLGVISSGDGLKDVIPKSIKDHAGSFEAAARSVPSGSAMSDPTTLMAIHTWFTRTAKLGLREFMANSHQNAAEKDKAYAALQEKHFGSNWEAITKADYAEGTIGTGSTGGTLVPTIVENDIIRQIKDAGKLFPMARQVQMTSKIHNMPSEATAVTVGWALEAGTLTQGEGTLSQKALTAFKIYGRAKMSIELVEDSNPGLLAYLLEVFTEKMAGQLDRQLVLGDGSNPAITGINGTSGINVVSTSATAAGRNLSWQLLVNTYVGASEGSAIENGVWIVSPKGYAAIQGLSDTAGHPIIKYDDTKNAPAGTILGRPIVLSARFGGAPGTDVTATLDDSTTSNTSIIYGVPSSILFGTRQGFRWDVTDQVGWVTYQMDARLTGRYGMIVGVPANFSRLTKVNY